MIIAGRTTRQLGIVSPWRDAYRHENGLSGGQGIASYDLHAAEDIVLPSIFRVLWRWLTLRGRVSLQVNSYTVETLNMPPDVGAWFALKSTHARLGLSQGVTWIDPGFQGQLVVEISNLSARTITIPAGSPVGQLICCKTEPTEGYSGRYQGQTGAQAAILEAAQ